MSDSANQPVYQTIWRCKGLADDAMSLAEMIDSLESAIASLKAMEQAGVRLRLGSESVSINDSVPVGVQDDYAFLETTDPAVAERFGFVLDEFEDEFE